MPIASLILVETSMPGNLGAAMRVAANFGVKRLELVRPMVDPANDEVLRWACGADNHLEIRVWDEFEQAVTDYRTLAATASARGRDNLPVMTPAEGAVALDDGRVFLLDSQLSHVLECSPDGKVVRELGHPGEGPGELTNPRDLVRFDDGTLGLAKVFPGELVMLHPDGLPAGVIKLKADDAPGGFVTLHRALQNFLGGFLALGDIFTEVAVTGVLADAGGDHVANAGQTEECFRATTEGCAQA